MQPTCGMKP
uniref:Uncharacterized protein n=1 Tax=Rhizophora mucronata TaxID=61149 RepID=A0A2P2LA78_RHIMU